MGSVSWFSVFALMVVTFFLNRLWEKLNDIERVLKAMEEYQAEANSSLRSLEHDSSVIREHTPSRR